MRKQFVSCIELAAKLVKNYKQPTKTVVCIINYTRLMLSNWNWILK